MFYVIKCLTPINSPDSCFMVAAMQKKLKYLKTSRKSHLWEAWNEGTTNALFLTLYVPWQRWWLWKHSCVVVDDIGSCCPAHFMSASKDWVIALWYAVFRSSQCLIKNRKSKGDKLLDYICGMDYLHLGLGVYHWYQLLPDRDMKIWRQ